MQASLELLSIDVPERIHTERLIPRCPQPGDGAALNAAIWLLLTRLSQLAVAFLGFRLLR